jgi:serine/threonine protein kinase
MDMKLFRSYELPEGTINNFSINEYPEKSKVCFTKIIYNGVYYGVKIFSKPYSRTYFNKEVYTMIELSGCKYIVNIINFAEDDHYFYIIMECGYDDVFSFKNNEYFDLDKCIKHVYKGIKYCHSLGITHGDIKPENVIVFYENDKFVYKLCDFGLSFKLNYPVPSVIGTEDYLSPETIRGKILHFKCDSWSFGIFIYEILTGRIPFKNDQEILSKKIPNLRIVKNGHYKMLIDKMLKYNPNERANFI